MALPCSLMPGIGARAVHLAAHAPAAPHGAAVAADSAPQRLQSTFGHAAADAVLQAVADDRMAGRRDVAVAHGVHQLELGGIEAEALRRLVDLESSA